MIGSERVISIDPHIPYLYLPKDDFHKFSVEMSKHFGKIYCKDHFCMFDTDCANVPDSNVPFEIRIYDV